MQSQIQQEVTLLMLIDNVAGTEQVKTLAICAQVLSCADYFKSATTMFEGMFGQSDFDIMVDIGRIVFQLVSLNGQYSFYKEISETRMKYVIYCVLYAYLIRNKSEWLSTQSIGSIRLAYCNAYDLLMVSSDSIKIAKTECTTCLSSFSSLFKSSKTPIA